MMTNQVIWKYPLEVTYEQFISMPTNPEILTVQVQRNEPCLWAKVDPDAKAVPLRVLTIGTGHDAKRTIGARYIGSYQLADGAFVGHVFVDAVKES